MFPGILQLFDVQNIGKTGNIKNLGNALVRIFNNHFSLLVHRLLSH